MDQNRPSLCFILILIITLITAVQAESESDLINRITRIADATKAEDLTKDGDVPNYMTIYGDQAYLTSHGHQEKNKYYSEYNWYDYAVNESSKTDVISKYTRLLEQYNIYLADTWHDETQTIYYYEYRGKKKTTPIKGLTALSDRSSCKPELIINVETFRAEKNVIPIDVYIYVSGGLNYLQPQAQKAGNSKNTIHLSVGKKQELEYTNIPYQYEKKYETYHWEITDGAEYVSLDNDNLKNVTIQGLKPGTAHITGHYEYSTEGADILTGKPEYSYHSTTQGFTIVISSGKANTSQATVSEGFPEIEKYFGVSDEVEPAGVYIDQSGRFTRYSFGLYDIIDTDTSIALISSVNNAFHLIRSEKGKDDSGLYEMHYYQYTGHKDIAPIFFDDQDPCEAHLLISIVQYPEYLSGYIDLCIVTGLEYDGAESFINAVIN
ncbi:MAG: hypothetical protein IKQ45_07840 [Clostridia bacterium]|nr:hypothetical protein [Clostridia bacterium]